MMGVWWRSPLTRHPESRKQPIICEVDITWCQVWLLRAQNLCCCCLCFAANTACTAQHMFLALSESAKLLDGLLSQGFEGGTGVINACRPPRPAPPRPAPPARWARSATNYPRGASRP